VPVECTCPCLRLCRVSDPFARFRWVALQLLAVSKCRSTGALHKTLSSLPSTLDETYARILDRIEEEYRQRIFHILQLICFSKRPIRKEEALMLWLVGNNTGGPVCADDILFDSEDIVDFFGGILLITRKNGCRPINLTWTFLSRKSSEELSIFQLAHFSVKEYLISSRAGYWTLAAEASHLSIIQYSIAYYLHAVAVSAMSPLPPDELLEKHSLAEYCCRYMSGHLNHLTSRDHPALTSTFHLLLHPDSNHIATTFGTLFFSNFVPRQWMNIPATDNHPLALILAASLGLSRVVSWLLTFDTVQEQIDTYVTNFDCGPPILEAIAKGHTDVMCLLLKHGANINQKGKYGNALLVASQNGQETVVQRLIEAGADINNVGFHGMTPIQVASGEGYKRIVKMLIKAGADVNTTNSSRESALHQATARGHKDVKRIVKMLLKAGADVNATDELGQSALHHATEKGHEDVVQALILAGADVNVHGADGTALHLALHTAYPETKVIRLLVDAGANVNQPVEEYQNALHAAIAGFRDEFPALEAAGFRDESSVLEVARIIIHAGADVNSGGGEHDTALQIAAFYNLPKVVEELVNAGADVNLVGGQRGTALLAAVCSDSYGSEHRIDVVQTLIRAGADLNLGGGWSGTTPLEEASDHGYTEIVQILLDAGAKPQKRPLLSPTDSESDAGEREGKRPRICDCTVSDTECNCTNSP
jgi:ankyrin repeat protein